MDIDDILETWRINQAINLELLAACPQESFELKPGSGKTIRSNFVHLVSVRRMWVQEKLPEQAEEIPKLDWKSASREEILHGLEASAEKMGDLFRKHASNSKAKKGSLVRFFAYCIAHEANHRSHTGNVLASP